MKAYQTSDYVRLLNEIIEDRRQRGYSELTAIAVAEMKLVDLIRRQIEEGEFGTADDEQSR